MKGNKNNGRWKYYFMFGFVLMLMMKIVSFTCVVVLFAACSNKYNRYASQYQFAQKSDIPNYNDTDYWAAHPWKKDPSDSVPKPLGGQVRDSLADVFFIHPTTYTEAKVNWNADVNDALLNAKTDYSTILYQGSVFNQHCRVFAPRYRQVHISAFFTVINKESRSAFDTAYADVRRAFKFYLEHYNNGRPIIIAGHSQGGLMAEWLLKEFFIGKPLLQKLVVAYVIGWPITKTGIERLPVCKDSVQTNCFCAWRTYQKGYEPKFVEGEFVHSFVTNPLSWTITDEYVSAERNKGSVLKNFNKIIPHSTDAQVHGRILWSRKPKFPGAIFYRSKNYHIADINLFYVNMRENIEQRIFAYLKTH